MFKDSLEKEKEKSTYTVCKRRHLTGYKEKKSVFLVFPRIDAPGGPYYYVSLSHGSPMSRNYKAMPPLWRVQELFQLSQKYPSGLEWRIKKACNEAGSQAGRLNKTTGYYMVCIDNVVYLAHRVVHYLRTGIDPVNTDVLHEPANKDKDNRKKLVPNKTYENKKNFTHQKLQETLL